MILPSPCDFSQQTMLINKKLISWKIYCYGFVFSMAQSI
jgi:hypothetical protein